MTIFSTDDVALLTNSPTSPLPIIQTPIPLAGFYWVAPFLLVALYFYFHIQLQHNWRIVSRLPAIFPDGAPIDQKLFPWQLNMWCRNFFPVLIKSDQPLGANWQHLLIVFLTWWSTPLVLIGFWYRYLPRHDLGTSWHLGLIILTFISALISYQWTKRSFPIDILWWDIAPVKSAALITFISCLIIITLSPIEHHYFRHANFFQKNVSFKPDNWDPKKPTQGVKGAFLENADLRFAMASEAFMVKANLIQANLSKAFLINANLQEASLAGTDLKEANLFAINLTKAKLYKTKFSSKLDLSFTELKKADLHEINLVGANLQHANLKKAQLKEVNLTKANLQHANLREASLSGVNLTEANLTGVNLANSVLAKIIYGLKFQKDKVVKTNLTNADLTRVNLQGASFGDVINLTCAQLKSAYIDKKTILPGNIKITGGVMGKVKFWENEIDVLKDYQCERIRLD